MADEHARKILIGALIPVLHLPLVCFAYIMYVALPPGEPLGPLALFALLVLTALPYTVLALLKIGWNPPRARLNEYDC
jgi:hypothetical protein